MFPRNKSKASRKSDQRQWLWFAENLRSRWLEHKFVRIICLALTPKVLLCHNSIAARWRVAGAKVPDDAISPSLKPASYCRSCIQMFGVTGALNSWCSAACFPGIHCATFLMVSIQNSFGRVSKLTSCGKARHDLPAKTVVDVRPAVNWDQAIARGTLRSWRLFAAIIAKAIESVGRFDVRTSPNRFLQ